MKMSRCALVLLGLVAAPVAVHAQGTLSGDQLCAMLQGLKVGGSSQGIGDIVLTTTSPSTGSATAKASSSADSGSAKAATDSASAASAKAPAATSQKTITCKKNAGGKPNAASGARTGAASDAKTDTSHAHHAADSAAAKPGSAGKP